MQRQQWVSAVRPCRRRWRFAVGGGTGKTRWYSFPTQAEAEQERQKALRAIERRAAEAAALTWQQVIEDYTKGLAETCAARSVEVVRGRLRRFFGAGGRDLARPARLDEDGAQALYDALRPTVSVQEHRHALSRAKALGAYLVSRKLWRENPLLPVRPVGKPKRGAESKPQLTRDEWRRLVRWCLAQREDEGARATLILCMMGLRASELCGLTVRDLDDGGRLLHVRGTKTEAARRDLAVPYPTPELPHVPDVRQLLQEQAIAARKRPQGEVVALSPPLWGRDRWWVWREVTRCCQAAEVPVVPPHGLRGTWASLCRAVGAEPWALARSMGHSSPAVQDRHYVERSAAQAGQQGAAVAALLPPK